MHEMTMRLRSQAGKCNSRMLDCSQSKSQQFTNYPLYLIIYYKYMHKTIFHVLSFEKDISQTYGL